ncbi:MAG: hypothetical protein AB1767_12915 [Bacillota bacterium]
MADSAMRALSILRDPAQFQWYVVPILVIVIFIYYNEIGKGNWSVVLAGLALWGMDWFNEIVNSIIFHLNGFAPLWGAPADTAYLILVGLNIEISMMFAILGIAAVKLLPADRSLKILGMPNRLFYALLNSVIAVGVEIVLNLAGALTWEFPFWSARFPLLIILFGYLHFFVVAYWVFDMDTLKKKFTAVGTIFAVDIALLLIFGVGLGWL